MKTTTRTELKSFVDDLKIRFLANPTGVPVEAIISEKLDEIIRDLWGDRDYPDSFALMAIGGYGRASIHPQSDVDLLFFFKDVIDEDAIKLLAQLTQDELMSEAKANYKLQGRTFPKAGTIWGTPITCWRKSLNISLDAPATR